MHYMIGTRGSKLALKQAEYVRDCLAREYPSDSFALKVVRTKGDRITDRPLDEIGGQGVFVREIERLILAGDIQLAVHSMKDLPCRLPAGLCLAPAWKREDARDVLILRERGREACVNTEAPASGREVLGLLPPGAKVGTGSRRRAVQLLAVRPDLHIVGLRGNVDTRLRKMQEQELDGIVLAAAGLKRLGMEEQIAGYFSTEEMVPAPTQGILAIELAEKDRNLWEKLSIFGDSESEIAARAERAFLAEMEADCHQPLGAYAEKVEESGQICISLRTMFTMRDQSTVISGYHRQSVPKTHSDGGGSIGISGCHREGFSDTGMTEGIRRLAETSARELRAQRAGQVVLVGAGPGDASLLTLAGKAAIEEADCIVYDRLIPSELLALAAPSCEQIYVGKERGKHTLPQEEINRLLVRKAMEHSRVVRLKGGDPYVFGRGGEEALYLREKGISFEMIPGVSSALAGPAYAGIPVTHRGKALGFHVFTAHGSGDALAALDFEALQEDTCVFLMGLGEVEEICRRLMEAGRGAQTPAAVISHAAAPTQRTVVATLETLAERVREAALTSPALIVVGEVVGLREELNFFEQRPLFGQRVLVAGTVGIFPREGGQGGLSFLLGQRGAQVEAVCAGRISPIPLTLSRESVSGADWLIFTSQNGVYSFFEALALAELDARALHSVQIAAIGSKTALRLREYGILADLIPKEANSVQLAAELIPRLHSDTKVWYIQNEAMHHPLTEALRGHCMLTELPAYRNIPPQEGELPGGERLTEYDRIYFTNALAIERLLGSQPEVVLRALDEKGGICVIGPECRKKLAEYGITRVRMAGHPDYRSLAEL